MAKMFSRTKAQKKRLIVGVYNKSLLLYMNQAMSIGDASKIQTICEKALVKIGYNKTDLK